LISSPKLAKKQALPMVLRGLFPGLYVGPELNAEFHNDKDKKIIYLQKIIRLVELMIGAPVEAKPQKIVAGLEPEVPQS
jgi:TRAF3-interacting protein 1